MKRVQDRGGNITLLLVLFLPFFLLLLAVTLEAGRHVATRIQMQNVLDEAVYAGASDLSRRLNTMARLNREIYRLYDARRLDFNRRGSKKSETDAKRQFTATRRQQELRLEAMERIAKDGFAGAYGTAAKTVRERWPEARLKPLYWNDLRLREGGVDRLSPETILGNVFDPKGHKTLFGGNFRIPKGYAKNPSPAWALAAELEVPPLTPLLPVLEHPEPFRSAAAAAPYGGSLWDFAASSAAREEFLYRTGMVPLKTLPSGGWLRGPYASEF